MWPIDVALTRRRHVVPGAAEFVVRHDDHRVARARALLDRVDERDEMITASGLGGVSGMLVLGADRLTKLTGFSRHVIPDDCVSWRNSASSRRCALRLASPATVPGLNA